MPIITLSDKEKEDPMKYIKIYLSIMLLLAAFALFLVFVVDPLLWNDGDSKTLRWTYS